MVFDPQHINESGKVKMTYQSMMQMAQLTGEIVNVLEKRVAAAREREIVKMKDCESLQDFTWNFYQLSRTYRNKLMMFTAEKLLNVFGSQEEIEKFRKVCF